MTYLEDVNEQGEQMVWPDRGHSVCLLLTFFYHLMSRNSPLRIRGGWSTRNPRRTRGLLPRVAELSNKSLHQGRVSCIPLKTSQRQEKQPPPGCLDVGHSGDTALSLPGLEYRYRDGQALIAPLL